MQGKQIETSVEMPPHRVFEKYLHWLETASNAQQMQFLIDCLPAIRQWMSGYERSRVLRVLDVGAGSGAGANLLAQLHLGDFLGNKLEVDALELQDFLVRYTRSTFPSIRYIVGDVLSLDAEQPWDLVFCSHTIEHLDDPISFARRLQELSRDTVMFYAPWQERERIAGHLVTIDETFLEELGATLVSVLESPAWRPAHHENPRCAIFTLRGTANDGTPA
ncbi:MAG: class I SAM-dependent methyltransferase [Bryobacteraceae bacterium]